MITVDPATLAAFLGAGLVLNLTPGADVMFALASGAQGGWRRGVAASFGIALGCLFHVLLTAFGMAALIAARPGALEVIRWAGAAYLLWLAWQAWTAPPARTAAAAVSTRAAIRRGVVTNVLNPKVALFILAFLPQFADPARGPIWAQMLFLGTLFAITGFGVTGVFGAAGGYFATRLARSGRWLNRISACVFAALALRLVLR